DVGSGTGINLLEAARVLGPCKRLLGVDLAPGMVEEARRKATIAGIPASFVVGDAEHLEVEDGSVDLVLCNSVYHWFPDRRRTIAELGGGLRKGGQVLVNCVAAPGFDEWIRVVDDTWRRLFGGSREWLLPLPTPGELLADLRGAGLAVEHLEYEVDPAPIQDVQAFLRTMTVIAPTWLAGVPQGGARTFMAAVTHALTPTSGGPFMVTGAGVTSVSRKVH